MPQSSVALTMASLEREHCIGYAGGMNESLVLHPATGEAMYIAGGTIAIADLDDPHSQDFLVGHDDDVTSMAMSPSGKQLATGQLGTNSDVIVWDVANKREQFRLQEHDYKVDSVAFSHDEKLLLSIGDVQDGKLFCWDLSSGNIVATQVHQGPEGTETMGVWGGFVKDQKRRPTKHYQFATASGPVLRQWTLDPHTGQLTSELFKAGAQQRVYKCLMYDAENLGDYVYAGTKTGDVCIYAIKGMNLATNMPCCGSGVLTLHKAPGGGILAGGGDGTIVLLSGSGKDLVPQSKITLDAAVSAMSVPLDGPMPQTLVAGTAKSTLWRINLDGGRNATQLISESCSDRVSAVAYNELDADSTMFATASHDKTVRLWNASDYTCLKAVSKGVDGEPISIALTDLLVITGWSDGTVRTYHTENMDLLWTMKECHRGGVTAMALSHNGQFMLTGGAEGDIRMWEIRSQKMISHVKVHGDGVTSISLFEDDSIAVTSSKDRSFSCVDLRNGKIMSSHRQKMGAINGCQLTNDEMSVVTIGSERKLTFWHLSEDNAVNVVPEAHRAEGLCLALSHDNSLIATGGADERIHLWSYPDGQKLAVGEGHSGKVMDIKFSPDDKQLISVGADGNIFIFNVYKA